MSETKRRKSVLIIDDSKAIRMQVRATLEEAGYDVVEACDGQAGVDALEVAPSLAMVLCDLNMPRMGGLEFLDRCQRSERLPRLPVVMLTTDCAPEEIMKAKSLGARGWIVKPFQADRLVATVRWIAGEPG